MVSESEPISMDTSLIQRLWGVLVSPKATFQSLSQSMTIWDLLVPLLVLLCLTLASQVLIGPVAVEEQRQRIILREDIPEVQKDVFLERLDGALTRPMRFVNGIGAAAVWYALLAGIVMFFGAFILGGQAGYRETLTVVLYASLVGVVEMALKIPLIMQLGTTKVKTGLTLLLPNSLDGTLIYRFFQRLDFFAMWKIVLVAMGVAAIYKVEEKRARIILFSAWVLAMFLLAWLLDGRGLT